MPDLPKKPLKKAILVADDETALADLIVMKLKSAGFDAQAVYDGAEALKALKKRHFSFLLLDLLMPKKSGYDVLRSLKRKHKGPPVIVLSNSSSDGDPEKIKALGALDFIVKSSVTLDNVLSTVRSLLKTA